jgi:hypothetical protein
VARFRPAAVPGTTQVRKRLGDLRRRRAGHFNRRRARGAAAPELDRLRFLGSTPDGNSLFIGTNYLRFSGLG